MTTRTRQLIAQGLALLTVIAFAFLVTYLARENLFVQTLVAQYGLLGLFLIALASGFNFVLPVPAAAFVPLFSESGLGIVSILATIVLGVTLADSIAYFVGKWGRTALEHTKYARMLARLHRARERHTTLPLVGLFAFAALVPLPNELLLIPLGLMGFRLEHVLPVLLAGNAIFNTLAGLGVLGIFNTLA